MAKVIFKNLRKTYPGEKGGEVTAVNDVSLEIQDREFVVLLGPSGCGHSSVLRMVAGLEETSRGDIFIGDQRVNDLPPAKRDIAMVFQNPALYPRMSVYDNMAFGLKLRRFPKAEIKKRVQDAAAILGLDDLLGCKPTALSGDRRHRVALGRAIVRQPKVFLFEEPLSDLDAEARVQLRTEITKLHQRLQATMIYATRNQVEAMAMAERIVAMKDGVVQQNDTPLTLYNAPVNLFVAGLLGSPPMNFIQGTLKEERGDLLFCEREGGTIEARLSAAERPGARESIGQPILLGIRPEEIKIAQSKKGQENGAATFPALVDVVEPMGAEANIYLETGSHTVICRSRRPLDNREAGRRMQFEINLKKAHLFDPGTKLSVL
jgi:multiple sugar transport system ATP-binding protein